MRAYLGGLGLVVIGLGGCSAKPLAGAEELALMDGVACARLEGGTVACWGRNLGSRAVLVPGVQDAVRIVSVDSLACVLRRGGRVGCFDTRGQGRPDPTLESLALVDQGWERVDEIAGADSLYARAGQKVYARGAYQVRAGKGEPLEMVVPPPEVPTKLVAARGHAWFLAASGKLGKVNTEQPEVRDDAGAPAEAAWVLKGVSTPVSNAGAFACVRRGTEATWCTGSFSLPWPGERLERGQAREVIELRGFEDISGGPTHLCARHDTQVSCVGANDFGQLGDGSNVAERSALGPVSLRAPARHVQVSVPAADLGGPPPLHAGTGTNTRSFACAVLTNGTVECWGYGHQGQLGDGSKTSRTRPVQVTRR